MALALARGLAVAGLLSVAGALAFRAFILPLAAGPAELPLVDPRLRRWLVWNAAASGLGMAGWLLALTGSLADPSGLGGWAEGAWAVLSETRFGTVLVVQAVLLALAVALSAGASGRVRPGGAAVLAMGACLAQIGHSHAYAMSEKPSVLVISELLHLGAGALWLGALVPLYIVVQAASLQTGALAARWFSPTGRICVVLMAASADVQAAGLVGSFDALLDSAYGWVALGKIVLGLALLGFAILNRYSFAPALLGEDPVRARRVLLRSLAWQSVVGLLLVLAAALLGQIAPAMDMSDMGG